ncbi:MAG: PAS domain S-box protein [Acidobacteria bacterium]|nr:PAS domain S-box protein [Acidobacteriota bacterium]
MDPRDQPPGSAPPDPAADTHSTIADVTLFAQMFDVSPFPSVVSRLSDATVIAINRRTAEIFGQSQQDAVGQKVTDYYVDPSQRADLAERLTRDGRADHLRMQIRRPDGTPFWALFSARLVTYEGERAVLTAFTDISDQVHTETILKASEQRLAAQSHALTTLTARYADPSEPSGDRLRGILGTCATTLLVDRVSMWRFTADRHAIECVGMYERPTDRYQCDGRLEREDCLSYFDALENERVIAAHDACSDRRTSDFGATYLAQHHIGAMLDVPLRQNNETIGVLCVEHVGGVRTWTADEQNFVISVANLIAVALADDDRRQALTRLAESDLRANLVIETAHDAFVGMDAEGRIVTWNAQAEKTFGWSRDEALGLSMVDTLVPARYREAHRRGVDRFHRTGDAPVVNQRLELAALHRSGREFPIEITITSPMPQEKGTFFGAFLRDISERREHEDQLRVAKETAEAATRAKSEFLANMSHELRTPLNGVLGYAQLLQRDRSLSAAQREALNAITKCGSNLLELINDVLDLSRIEAGRLTIEATSTDLDQLTLDLEYVLADAARRKGLKLTTAIAPDVPRRVVLDGRHLRQVLLNLLGNAIKFTSHGEVRLGIARGDDGRLTFEVVDTGIGIEPEALDVIFEAFTQTRAGASAGGSGLGLTISQHLIRRMGDQLKVESTPGAGSRFYFTLPLVPGAPSSKDDPETDPDAPGIDARLAPDQHVTALVVDDSTVSRRILASLLESAGILVIKAAGGLEAVDLARQHRPDVIFMDLRMSDLDGLEATRRIKANPATAVIPVIVVTASAFGDSRQAALDAGCADYLPKPIRAELLFAVLRTHLGVRFVTGAGDDPVDAPGLPDPVRRAAVRQRLADALTIGNVTDLERLANDLGSGAADEATLGERIGRLAADFDFEGLRRLADALAAGDEPRADD